MPGGMPPRTPPLLVTSRAHSPFLCFLDKRFLANEHNIFGEGVKNYKKPHKTLTNKWRAWFHLYARRDNRDRERDRQDIKGCRALGVPPKE